MAAEERWHSTAATAMSLETIIHAGLTRPSRPIHALVLMGGGARPAYQVGALHAVATMLELQTGGSSRFPFQVLVGTSAGALNVAYLASAASGGLLAFEQLAQFWHGLRSADVYQLDLPRWARYSRLTAAVGLWRQANRTGAILDTMRLVDTLHRGRPCHGTQES